ncbi:DUF2855 family protein [Litorivivens sp.]|uniref:DUF2855 family protein n=1 Tax=Litorivivens sp. TaxID=2020868 RepID=UPI0035684BC0
MTSYTELWVEKSDFRKTRVVTDQLRAIEEGEIVVAIDKFGLTANNVTYAVMGDAIGYWKFYPAPDNWGKVTVWGCANVVESRCEDVEIGERLYGFFPMSSHAILQPGKIRNDNFRDIAPHRTELPGSALYSNYRRTQREPELVQQFENERCLLFPLMATGYVLYDYLVDNDCFGAKQIIIGSVSSKTGFSLATLLHDDPSVSAKVIGLTSPGNTGFVEALGCCDQIVIYGHESSIDPGLPAAYIDMAGDAKLTQTLHNHLGDNMVESAMVGASHWEDGGPMGELPGAKPNLFFAPAQIAKRDKEWGPGEMSMKAMQATMKIAEKAKSHMQIEWVLGAEAVEHSWHNLLDNKVPGSTGIMASLLSQPE